MTPGYATCLCVLVACCWSVSTSRTRSASGPVSLKKGREGICKDINIQNNAINFKQLENCTVVEGYVRILLLHYAKKEDYKRFSFPKLVEITDYLLLYRAAGLVTLRTIFPNLAVIRGRDLFNNYALLIYENQDIEEVGLISLTEISRGAVQITKNLNLCYYKTIDWSLIARAASTRDHVFDTARGETWNDGPCKAKFCAEKCPDDARRHIWVGVGYNHKLCWNNKDCQKLCHTRCTKNTEGYKELAVCAKDGQCCHEQCIGGCSGPRSRDCTACRKYLQDGNCVAKCKAGFYIFWERRCISEARCRKTDRRVYKLFNKTSCVRTCPPGYETLHDDRQLCVACKGKCPKVCNGAKIKSVADMIRVRGCTELRGILHIEINGGKNIARELENSLGQITVVRDYVQIVRSHALVSLNFLSSLRKIGGVRLNVHDNALVVMDNQNLQDIWNYTTHPNLTIERGKVFFHMNSFLCYDKMIEFVHSIGFVKGINYTDGDVSHESNGDKASCNIIPIDLAVTTTFSTAALVRWSKFTKVDQRSILAYVIYYREAPFKNISIYSGRDACNGDVWMKTDIDPTTAPRQENAGNEMFEMIYPLKPFTQYVVYVQPYILHTVANNIGARTPLVYFTTQMSHSTPPTDVRSVAENENELTIRWNQPEKMHSNITHYLVYWLKKPYKRSQYEDSNFCSERLRVLTLGSNIKDRQKTGNVIQTNNTTPGIKPNGKCSCKEETNEQKKEKEQDRAMMILFENVLINAVFQKRPPPSSRSDNSSRRLARAAVLSTISPVHGTTPLPALDEPARTDEYDGSIDSQATYTVYDGNATNGSGSLGITDETEIPEIGDAEWQVAEVHGKNLFVLPGLDYFSIYSIDVIACPDDEMFCGYPASTTARTLQKNFADDIDPSYIGVDCNDTSRVELSWQTPKHPNGLVLSFDLEYQLLDKDEPTKKKKVPTATLR